MRSRSGPALLVAGVVGLLLGCDSGEPTRPNLVLLSADELAADRLGCFGGAPGAGPSICALGDRGTRFAWAVSEGRGEASGVATMLTGLSEAEHGVLDDGRSFLADDRRTLAEDLGAAGYSTAAFVTSPRVNRSRRLDQGFAIYRDRLASPGRRPTDDPDDLVAAVRRWTEDAPPPWFVWIHVEAGVGLPELDRLVSRLSTLLEDGEEPGAAVLFTALRGETGEDHGATDAGHVGRIDWRSHRIPLVWRPAGPERTSRVPVSRALAGLVDVAPTLRAAAGLPAGASDPRDASASPAARPREMDGRRSKPPLEPGRDLTRLGLPPPDVGVGGDERSLVLGSGGARGEVGVATTTHLYARGASPLDGTGQPVPTPSLRALDARFAAVTTSDDAQSRDDAALAPDADARSRNSAALAPGPWRRDLLDPRSPVPRLEVRLAEALGRRALVGRRGTGGGE